MKKYILSSIVGFAAIVNSYGAFSLTTVVQPGQFTNLIANFPGSVYVQQFTVAANSTNVSGSLIDTPTNSLTFTTSAYTNIVRYATNYVSTWTNYYGATNSWTNVVLIDITNNLVPAATNTYPVRLSVAALAGTSVQYGINGSLGYYFDNGVWFTNTSSGIATVTVSYR